MARKALFITVGELKRKSVIDGGVDSDKIVQYIEIAQDTHIQNYLGGTLYKKIQQLVVDGEINLSANSHYKLLIDDYIKDMLIWFTQSTYLPFSMFTINNGGVYKHISENSDSASKEEVDGLIQRCRDMAEFYTKRYMDYMCNNSNLYTEYSNNDEGEMYPDKDLSYSGGWVL